MWMKWLPYRLGLAMIGFILYQAAFSYPFSIHVEDKTSLQRGAKLFMNYCSGCHSLKYVRYTFIVDSLGLRDVETHSSARVLKNNLIFTESTINDPIRIAMPSEDAKQWFGIVPPDLSLVAREKGPNWLFSYLSGFYRDDTRPFGTNNHLVPNVAMPNILEPLSEELTKHQFTLHVHDLVAFLDFVGEPIKSERFHMGFFVIGFLVLFWGAALGLKRVYWRKIGIK